MHAAFGRAVYAAPLAAAALLLVFAGPFLLPLAAFAPTAPLAAAALAAAALAALAVSRDVAFRFFHLSRRGLLLVPLGAAVLAFVLLDSAYRAATGRTIQWKGRPVR